MYGEGGRPGQAVGPVYTMSQPARGMQMSGQPVVYQMAPQANGVPMQVAANPYAMAAANPNVIYTPAVGTTAVAATSISKKRTEVGTSFVLYILAIFVALLMQMIAMSVDVLAQYEDDDYYTYTCKWSKYEYEDDDYYCYSYCYETTTWDKMCDDYGSDKACRTKSAGETWIALNLVSFLTGVFFFIVCMGPCCPKCCAATCQECDDSDGKGVKSDKCWVKIRYSMPMIHFIQVVFIVAAIMKWVYGDPLCNLDDDDTNFNWGASLYLAFVSAIFYMLAIVLAATGNVEGGYAKVYTTR